VPPIDHVTLTAGAWRLRPPRPDDAALALIMLQDRLTAQWNPAPVVVDEASARAWCRRGADWTGGGHATWTVADEHDRLVGNVSIFGIDRTDQRSALIGYRTAPWARGRGVASGAVTAATAWAVRDLGLERLELAHAVDNVASCRVAEHCGYQVEGTLRSRYRDPAGRRWDEHLHGYVAAG